MFGVEVKLLPQRELLGLIGGITLGVEMSFELCEGLVVFFLHYGVLTDAVDDGFLEFS